MKKLRRKFLTTDERFSFGVKKGSVFERYCDKSWILKSDFNIYIDYGIPPAPTKLTVSLIYHDKESVEYIIQHKLSIPDRNTIVGRQEIKLPVIVRQAGKELHKIKFESLPLSNSSVYISISGS